jgi:hypothetical protein
MQQTTGMTRLVGVRPDGERIALTLAIGHPFPTPAGDWGCPVTLGGLQEQPASVYGHDSLQAICLAIAFLRSRLTSFIADGGRILDPGTGEDFAPDAHFGPAPR